MIGILISLVLLACILACILAIRKNIAYFNRQRGLPLPACEAFGTSLSISDDTVQKIQQNKSWWSLEVGSYRQSLKRTQGGRKFLALAVALVETEGLLLESANVLEQLLDE